MNKLRTVFASLIFLFSVISDGAHGFFNLYMSPKEVKKMMGLEMELYYVKEGIVNSYAVNFILNVNSSIEELEFTWQGLRRQTVSHDDSLSTQSLNLEYFSDAIQHPNRFWHGTRRNTTSKSQHTNRWCDTILSTHIQSLSSLQPKCHKRSLYRNAHKCKVGQGW